MIRTFKNMALFNFCNLLLLLSKMSNIPYEILLKNKNDILKSLSPLGELSAFDAKKCAQAISSIEIQTLEKIGIKDEIQQKEFRGNLFVIFKEHWASYCTQNF